MESGVKDRQRERILKSRPGWRKTNQVKRLRIVMTVVLVVLSVSVVAGCILAWFQVRPEPEPSVSNAVEVFSMPERAAEPSYDDENNLLVVSDSKPIPGSFSPVAVNVGKIQVDRRVEKPLKALLDAAARESLSLQATQGYVDAKTQEKKYQDEVDALIKAGNTRVRAESLARKEVPPGGYSEYQTGMLVDFSADSQQSFGETREYRWLLEKGVEFGFVLRFPANKEKYTLVPGDPSRFRYVGKENAVKMRELSLCLEEYVLYVKNQGKNK